MGQQSPTVIQPTVTPPTLYQSVIPFSDIEAAGKTFLEYKKNLEAARQESFAQLGTPAQMGARVAERNLQSAASYLSSIPTGDKYSQATGSGASGKDPFAAARSAATQDYTAAQTAYASALKNINAKPYEIDTKTVPSWAQSTIPEGMPPAPTPAPAPAPAPAPKPSPFSAGQYYAQGMFRKNG